MTSLRVLLARIRDSFQGRRRDEELTEEIQAHLDLLAEEHIRRGLSPSEARDAARRDFGGVQQMREACRDQRGLPFLNGIRQDLRFAARLIVKDRWLTLVAVITLGLGIGASNTVFTFVNAARLRGLPVDEPDRILTIYAPDPSARPAPISYDDFRKLRVAARTVGIAAYRRFASTLSDEARAPEQSQSLYVSANGFRLLGVAPILGRDFLAEDDRPGAPPVVMLGESLWKKRYGGDPGIVGRAIQVNGLPTIVIGVMPEGFEFDYFAELWQPLELLPSIKEGRAERALSVFGRLAEGLSLTQAQSELASVGARLAQDDPGGHPDFRLMAEPFTGSLSSDPMMVALLGAVGFVLLIGCANVANLLLARSAHRSRELSIRVSVGATRYRILRQLLVESAILASLAGLLGFGLSLLGVRMFASAVEGIAKPYWIHWTMDARVFTFLAAVSIATGVLFGLAPALHLSKTNLTSLKAGGRTDTGGIRVRRWTSSMLIAELALTLALLAGAGLLFRSFLELYRLDLAIDTAGMTTMALRLPEGKYRGPEQWAQFFQSLEERLSGMGAISSATIASTFPFAGAASRKLFLEKRPSTSGESAPTVSYLTIGARYFDTLGLRLVRGNGFSDIDGKPGHESAIVNELFVKIHFPDQEPIGQRIGLADENLTGGTHSWVTIIGVAPTVRQRTLQKPDPVVYLPYRADPLPFARLLVRSDLETSAVTSLLREEVRAIDPDLPLYGIMAMDELLSQSRWPHRVFGIMLAVFAAIAVVLSAVGLYAVVAYSVTRRTQEIGVRMAFGARGPQVIWLVARRLLIPLSMGLILGMAGALGVGRLLKSMLVQTSSTDPFTLVTIAVLLLLVCGAAGFLPVRRATHLEPVLALRHE